MEIQVTAVDDQREPRLAVRKDSSRDRTESTWKRQYWVALLAIYCVGFAIYVTVSK